MANRVDSQRYACCRVLEQALDRAMERCLRRVERIFRSGQIRAGINLSTAASAAQRYDPSETVWPPFFANRENLDEEVPNEISGEDLNGLRLLDKALDEALVQWVWRYRALVGIREVEPGPERPLTEGERHARQWLDPVTFEAGRQRFPQFLNQSKGQLAASEKEAVCFMMAMSDADEFVCRYIVAREFPGGRTLRDLCDLWLDAIGAMEPVYKENPTVRKQRLPTAVIRVGDKPAAANPEMTPRTRNVLAEPVITQVLHTSKSKVGLRRRINAKAIPTPFHDRATTSSRGT